MKKNRASILTVLLMVLALAPATAFAEPANAPNPQNPTAENPIVLSDVDDLLWAVEYNKEQIEGDAQGLIWLDQVAFPANATPNLYGLYKKAEGSEEAEPVLLYEYAEGYVTITPGEVDVATGKPTVTITGDGIHVRGSATFHYEVIVASVTVSAAIDDGDVVQLQPEPHVNFSIPYSAKSHAVTVKVVSNVPNSDGMDAPQELTQGTDYTLIFERRALATSGDDAQQGYTAIAADQIKDAGTYRMIVHMNNGAIEGQAYSFEITKADPNLCFPDDKSEKWVERSITENNKSVEIDALMLQVPGDNGESIATLSGVYEGDGQLTVVSDKPNVAAVEDLSVEQGRYTFKVRAAAAGTAELSIAATEGNNYRNAETGRKLKVAVLDEEWYEFLEAAVTALDLMEEVPCLSEDEVYGAKNGTVYVSADDAYTESFTLKHGVWLVVEAIQEVIESGDSLKAGDDKYSTRLRSLKSATSDYEKKAESRETVKTDKKDLNDKLQIRTAELGTLVSVEDNQDEKAYGASVMPNQKWVNKSGYVKLQSACEQAKAVNDDEKASQRSIDEATKALEEAFSNYTWGYGNRNLIQYTVTNITYDGAEHQAIQLDAEGFSIEKVQFGEGTSSATNAGTYSVEIKPLQDFYWYASDPHAKRSNDWKTITWSINRKLLTGASVQIGTSDLPYTGTPQLPQVAVTLNGVNLVQGRDFEVVEAGGKDTTQVGSYTALVNGLGNYSGSLTAGTFSVTAPEYPTDENNTNQDTGSNTNQDTGSNTNSGTSNANTNTNPNNTSNANTNTNNAGTSTNTNNASNTKNANTGNTNASNTSNNTTKSNAGSSTKQYPLQNAASASTGTNTKGSNTASNKKKTASSSPKKPTLTAPKVSIGINATKKYANVSWKAVTNANRYTVFYKKPNAKKWKTVTTAKTSVRLKSLSPKGFYQVRVRAAQTGTSKLLAAVGPYSSTRNIYIKGMSKVVTLKAGAKQLRATWKKTIKVTGYRVYYSTNKKMTNAKALNVKGAKTVTKLIKKLAKGKTYYVRIAPYKVYKDKTYVGSLTPIKKVKVK